MDIRVRDIEIAVIKAYLQTLGRTPDYCGKNGHVESILCGRMTTEGLISTLRNSFEYREKLDNEKKKIVDSLKGSRRRVVISDDAVRKNIEISIDRINGPEFRYLIDNCITSGCDEMRSVPVAGKIKTGGIVAHVDKGFGGRPGVQNVHMVAMGGGGINMANSIIPISPRAGGGIGGGIGHGGGVSGGARVAQIGNGPDMHKVEHIHTGTGLAHVAVSPGVSHVPGVSNMPGFGTELGAYGSIGNIDKIKASIKDKLLKENRIDLISTGLMLGRSGFGKATRNYTYFLDQCGVGGGVAVNIRADILDRDEISCSGTHIGKRLLQLRGNLGGDLGTGLSCFHISMNYPTGVRRIPGAYNIAYVMFETVDFPQRFVHHLNINCDEVWTPSEFNRANMVRAGVNVRGGVHTMPLGVDTSLFDPNKPGIGDKSHFVGNLIGMENKYVFLCVMGFSERKGASILVRAFSEEFSNKFETDNVMLYIKSGWYPHGRACNDINEARRGIPGKLPFIHVDSNIYPDEVLASLYKNCDCFVLPSRGEGWSLPSIEAMSMEMPTIATRWSGNLEFMNDSNSYLINVEGFAEEPRCHWITPEYRGQKFAVPSKNHLRQLMRHVYQHREEAKAKGLKARQDVVSNFDWSVSCARMKNRLEQIARG